MGEPVTTASRLDAVLDEIDELLEGQEDVRDGSDRPLPNKAMSLLAELRAARALRSESAPSQSPWVMTADRLPAHGEHVLFLTRAGSWLGWHDQKSDAGQNWLDHFDHEPICTTLEVLCWMPVPATPTKFTVTQEVLDHDR